MMKRMNRKGAAKRAFVGEDVSAALLRRAGALILAVCLLAAIPMDAAAAQEEGPAPTEAISGSASDGTNTPEDEAAPTEPGSETMPVSGNDDDLVFVSGLTDSPVEKDPSDLRNFLTDLSITDSEGKPVDPKDGTLYVGGKYTIHMGFQEGDVEGLQLGLNESGQLTYQIPRGFAVSPRYDQELYALVNGVRTLVGAYSVDENGLLTVTLNDDGKEAMREAYDFTIEFNMDATAQRREGGDDSDYNFGGAGQDFDFRVMDQPRASVEKTGQFTEDEDKKGGVLDYTVKTTVEHGDINDVVVEDVLTPPQTDAFKLEQVTGADGKPAVTVTVTTKDAEGKEILVELGPDDYELKELEGDPNNPQDKAFRVKLKEGSAYNPLKEGSVLDVTYRYNVQYVEGATNIFWGNVENVANVTGRMPVGDPEKPGTTIDSYLDETRSSSVELYVAPPGHGVVSKDQDYSEATHTLHYTLYTVVPAGEWAPLYIFDDTVVNYNGKNYYLQEFQSGRVKDLKVKAVDVPDWFTWGDGKGNLSAEELQRLKDLQSKADEVQVFDYYKLEEEGYKFYDPESGDPPRVDQCVCRYGGSNFNIIFGLTEKEKNSVGQWGHWKHDTDRLIITEYDLDMSTIIGGTVTLVPLDGKGETLTLGPDDVLKAGIKNNVNLRFGNYYPGYSVFFNNREQMNKTGGLRKEDGNVYIDYTVTMNTTDKTVNKYFCDVNADMWLQVRGDGTEEHPAYGWGSEYYKHSMQAVFYDELPKGWEYVKGTLSVTTLNNGKTQTFFYPEDNEKMPAMLTDDGRAINALLILFRDDVSGDENHELFNAFSERLVSLTFKYTLKATEEWLDQVARDDLDKVTVNNYAEIRDINGMHWNAKAQNDYIPDRLTKTAKRVGSEFGNLLEFTLDVNPGNKMFIQPGFDKAQSYLLVTDESTNLQVQTESITVADAVTGEVLLPVGNVELDTVKTSDNWQNNAWGTVPSEEGQFRLVIPNGRHLTVTYNALITQKGDNVPVSNKASIDGLARSNSGFDESLKVDKMDGGGSARTYGLYVKKEDAESKKGLSGAEFEFYLVLTGGEGSMLEATRTIPVGDVEYSCYRRDDWTIDTGEDGGFRITADMDWMLSEGHYYILVETKAPDGYIPLKEPILFYYGAEGDIDRVAYPQAVFALPGGDLTVYNTPIQSLRVVKKGSAGEKPFPLAGAQFELCEAVKNAGGTYSPAGSGESYSGVSQNGDGYVVWGDGKTELHLTPNSYYILRETAAPEGYVQVEGDIVLYATEDGKLTVEGDLPEGVTVPAEPADGPVFELTVVDPSGYVLPESGGVGTTWLYGLGTTLILTAAMVLVCDSRRRRTRS